MYFLSSAKPALSIHLIMSPRADSGSWLWPLHAVEQKLKTYQYLYKNTSRKILWKELLLFKPHYSHYFSTTTEIVFWALPNYEAGLVVSCRLSQDSWLKLQQRMEAHFLIQPNMMHPFVPLYWGESSGLIRSDVIKCWNLTFIVRQKKKKEKKRGISFPFGWNRMSWGLRCACRKANVLLQ